ncbi:MAG: low molecular weight protein arginine phosphatase [Dethiobacteria bacterium]|jgi:protein-tyrosine-phosphatase
MKRILFVCTGNTCRSALAHGLLQQKARDNAGPQIEVKSAGLAALEGLPAADFALEVLQEKGIDFFTHRSRLLTSELVEEADLILVMTRAHKEELLKRFPEARQKTHLLSTYAAGEEDEIPDPIGGAKDEYINVAKKIEEYLEKLWPLLEK